MAFPGRLLVVVALCLVSSHALTDLPQKSFCLLCQHFFAPYAHTSVRTYDHLLDFWVERYNDCVSRQGAKISKCDRKYLRIADGYAWLSKGSQDLHEYVCTTIGECFGEENSAEDIQEVEEIFSGENKGLVCNTCLSFYEYLYRSVAMEDLSKALQRWSKALCETVQSQQRYDCYLEVGFRIERILTWDPRQPCEALAFCHPETDAVA